MPLTELNTEPNEKIMGASDFLILMRFTLLIVIFTVLGCATTDTYKKNREAPVKPDQSQDSSMDRSAPNATGTTGEYGRTTPYGRTSPYYDDGASYDPHYPESYDRLPPAQPVYPTDPGMAAPSYPGPTQRQYQGYENSPYYPDSAGSQPYNQPQQEADNPEPRRRRLIWKGDDKSGKAWEDAPPEETTEIEDDEYKGAEDYLNEANN